MSYQVNEIFNTVQGEGVWIGTPASFIRLQGCTVGCPWCDTKYTWKKGGTRMEVSEIIEQVQYKHVVITGGEPTLYDLDELINALWREKGAFVTMETSGQNSLKGKEYPEWITWSPKRNLNFRLANNLHKHVDEVKFVVDDDLRLPDIVNCLTAAEIKPHLMGPVICFMPEGAPPTKVTMQKAYELAQDFAYGTSFKVRFSDRLQYRLGVK